MKSAPGSTFSLVDVNEQRLDAAYGLAKRYAKELGVEIKFEKSLIGAKLYRMRILF